MIVVRVLGGLAVEVGDRPVPLPEAARARSLLAWLAVNPGAHARGDLAGRLRPDALQESARKSLRQAAWALRASLGDDADALLVAGRDRIGLAPDALVDLAEMRRLRREGRLDDALAHAGGDLLPDLDDEWVVRARDEVREEILGLLEERARAAEGAGDPAGAIAWTRRRVALDPLAEVAHRDLMRRLAGAGDRSAALAAYEALRGTLRRELGTLPSPETRRMAEDLRRGAPVGAPPATAPRSSRPAARRRLPGPLDRRTPMVGRADARRRLVAAWEAARSSGPSLCLIAGEPGIGKTRLAAWLAEEAGAGAVVLYGRCDEDGLVPYAPFGESVGRFVADLPEDAVHRLLPPGRAAALAALVPGLAAAVDADAAAQDPETRRHRAFEALRLLLEDLAAAAPVLLVVDDLHWADRATLAALRHLVRLLEPCPLLVLGTYRDTDVAPGHPLLATLAELGRDTRISRLALTGLDDREVAELAEARGGPAGPDAAAALRLRTAGNPFFVEELLADIREGGGGEALPSGVRAVIDRRLDRLGPEVGRTLATAALIGPEFEVGVLVDAVGDDERVVGALEAGESAALVAPAGPGGRRYGFVHALVADALAARPSPLRRARIHRRIAEALAARAGEGVTAAEVARHWAQAGDDVAPEVVTWSCRAAAEAREAFAYAEAAAHVSRALEAAGPDAGRRATLLADLGDHWNREGSADRGRAAFRDAAALAAELGDAGLLARAALGMGGLGTNITHADGELVATLERALAAQPAGDAAAAVRARLLARLAVESYYADRVAAADRSARAVEEARRSGDGAALAIALNARRVVLWDAEHADERLEVSSEMVLLAEGAGEPEWALQGRNWRVIDLLELGLRSEAEAEIARYARDAARLRLPRYAWYVPLWRATLADVSGRWDEGAALRARAEEEGERAQDDNAGLFVFIQACQALLDRGLPDRVDVAAIRARGARSPDPLAWGSWPPFILAARGETAAARDALARLVPEDLATVPSDLNWHVLAEVTETAAAVGDAARAAAAYRRLAPHARLFPVVARGAGWMGSVEYFLGRAAGATGDLTAADAHFTRAADAHARRGLRPRLALTLVRHAAAIAAREPGRARDLALRGRAEAEAVGDPRLLREAAALLGGA